MFVEDACCYWKKISEYQFFDFSKFTGFIENTVSCNAKIYAGNLLTRHNIFKDVNELLIDI